MIGCTLDYSINKFYEWRKSGTTLTQTIITKFRIEIKVIIVLKVCGKRDQYNPDTYDKFHNKYGGGILYTTVVKYR